MSDRVPRGTRELVIRRADGCCEYCGCPQAYCPDSFSVEHVQPRRRGGNHDESNLALSCQGCNGRKHTAVSAMDPATGELVPLYNPRTDEWSVHFGWNEDRTLIIGITATGRATVERLSLNRLGIVNLRRLLMASVSQGEPRGE